MELCTTATCGEQSTNATVHAETEDLMQEYPAGCGTMRNRMPEAESDVYPHIPDGEFRVGMPEWLVAMPGGIVSDRVRLVGRRP